MSPLPESIPHCSKLLPVVIVKKLFELFVLLYHGLRHHYWEWRSQKTTEEGTVYHKIPNGVGASGDSRGGGKKAGKSRKQQRDTPHRDKNKEEKPIANHNQPVEEKEDAAPVNTDQVVTAQRSMQPPQVTTTPSHSQPTTSDGNDTTKGGSSSAEPGGGKLVIEDSSLWSQHQQKQLEWAISNYSHLPADQRWTPVAEAVPGKSKVHSLHSLNNCHIPYSGKF